MGDAGNSENIVQESSFALISFKDWIYVSTVFKDLNHNRYK